MARIKNNKRAKGPTPSIRARIIAALENDKWDYRTIHGIASELRIPVGDVRRVVTSDSAIRASVMRDKKGQRLYTTKNRKSAFGDYVTAFRAINAAKMGEGK